MSIITQLLDWIIHLDKYIAVIVANFGIWSYVILFAVVLAETGLVIAPFLPGDSLLFTAGAIAALKTLNIYILFIGFTIAAILGDSLNYWIGTRLGTKIFRKDAKILKREYLTRTRQFYKKYGGKTIVIARFLPIIRTVAPFMAGVGKMNYGKFLLYNIIGGLVWVSVFLFSGYFFGQLPFVKENFSLVVVVIIVTSLIPAVYEYIRHRRQSREKKIRSV